MNFKGKARPLTGAGVVNACALLDAGEPEIRAVLNLQTNGSGLLQDHRNTSSTTARRSLASSMMQPTLR